MTHAIFTFHVEIYLCLHCVIVAIIVTQNLHSWNQDGHRGVWYDVIFVFKLQEKKVIKKWKKSKGFG